MPRTDQWKSTEKTIARRLGGRRIGITGLKTEDVSTDWLCCEVKHRKTLPAWLKAALQQAISAAKDGRLPIAILHEAGRRHDNDIVCLRFADFVNWFGDIEVPE